MDIVGIKRFLNKNKNKTLDEIISESVVNGIGKVIGDSSSPIGEDTIFGLLKGGMVKSVQRGRAQTHDLQQYEQFSIGSYYITARYVDVTISPVNLSKSILIINGSPFTVAGTNLGKFQSKNTIRLYETFLASDSNPSAPRITCLFCDWQVIEFN